MGASGADRRPAAPFARAAAAVSSRRRCRKRDTGDAPLWRARSAVSPHMSLQTIRPTLKKVGLQAVLRCASFVGVRKLWCPRGGRGRMPDDRRSRRWFRGEREREGRPRGSPRYCSRRSSHLPVTRPPSSWCRARLAGPRKQPPAAKQAAPLPLNPAARHAALTEQLNQNTVTVMSGNPNGTYLYLAYDMSAVLDDGNDLRVLPIIGKGGYQNVIDTLHLRGVDLCITQANIMSYLKKTGEFGTNIDQRLAYIARLYNEEMHVLAGPGINSRAGPQRQEGQLQRRRQRHAVLGPPDLRAARHQGPGGQRRPGRRLPEGQVRRDRRHHPDRRQADRRVRQVQDGARHDAAAGAVHGGSRAGLSAGQADQRGLPEPDPQGQLGRHGGDPLRAGRLQLAARYRPLPPRRRSSSTRSSRSSPSSRRRRATSSGRRPTSAPPCAAGSGSRPRRNGWPRHAQRTAPTASVAIDPTVVRTQAAKAAPNDPAEQERLFKQFMEWSRAQQKR